MASIEIRIAASEDDSDSTTTVDTDGRYAVTGGMNFGGAGLYFWHFRWSVAIAGGATIDDGCYIQVTALSSDADSNEGTLEVYNEHNCEAFSNPKRNDARIAALSAAWTIGSIVAEETYNSPEIKTLLQAWLDLAGHESDDYFGVQLSTILTDYLYQAIYANDDTAAKSALLHIEYTPADTAVPMPSLTAALMGVGVI